MVSVRPFLVVLVGLRAFPAWSRVVTVTGATGRTGKLVYNDLKKQGFTVRALVRNTTKAKEALSCDKCDESEGIYVGDVTKAETLSAVMAGTDSLVITTGPAYHCLIPRLFIGCHYYTGEAPKDITWEAVKTQVTVLAKDMAVRAPQDRHVVLLGTEGTATPDNPLDKIDNAHGLFYALNGEAFTMESGVKFTILKPSMLTDEDAGKKEIFTGHDDQGWPGKDYGTIARADVARLLAFAVASPEMTTGLRFDVSSGPGTPTTDLSKVFKNATYDWDRRTERVSRIMHV